jgi:hypothetical protein
MLLTTPAWANMNSVILATATTPALDCKKSVEKSGCAKVGDEIKIDEYCHNEVYDVIKVGIGDVVSRIISIICVTRDLPAKYCLTISLGAAYAIDHVTGTEKYPYHFRSPIATKRTVNGIILESETHNWECKEAKEGASKCIHKTFNCVAEVTYEDCGAMSKSHDIIIGSFGVYIADCSTTCK